MKSASETVNTSDVLQNDDALLFAVTANQECTFTFTALIDIKAASDFKYTFTVPSGAIILGFEGTVHWRDGAAVAADVGQDLTAIGTMTTSSPSTNFLLSGEAVVLVGANAGNVQFQWAQNTSTAEDTIVRLGSNLRYFCQ